MKEKKKTTSDVWWSQVELAGNIIMYRMGAPWNEKRKITQQTMY